VVNWNGSALATTFVSESQLTATVAASDIASANTASVTVVNPSAGGGTSNVVFFEVTPSASSITLTASAFTAGSGPTSAVTADFNEDGKLDLAVANNTGDDVSIFLGNGDGTFQPGMDYGVGASPTSGMMAADLNGDGIQDLAVANYSSNNVSVLIGNGDGTFQPAVNYDVGNNPTWVAVGDFNGDGEVDLAVSDQNCVPRCGPGVVSILLGNGDGTLQPHVDYGAAMGPNSVTVGDFNGDGRLDLAVAAGNGGGGTQVSVLLGNGDGSFQSPVNYTAGLNPAGVATADFNNDGKLDLAVVNNIGSISILLGNGDGTFQTHFDYSTGFFPIGTLGVADFNGDGKVDLAVANSGSSNISILLGNGDGTFQPQVEFATGVAPHAVVTGDFNADGRLDLAVPNNGDSTVSVLLQATGPLAVLSPSSLNFGTQLIGTESVSQTVTLSNTGIATLDISSIAGSPNFSKATTCGTSLAAGASCHMLVNFIPSTLGTVNGTLTITDNAPGSPHIVSLTGAGTEVVLSPANLNFGNQPVDTRAFQTVTFTNHGKAGLSISQVSFTGANPSDFGQTNTCGSRVAAGASCTFRVTFTPRTTGSRTATLNITDTGGGSPQTVALSGTGT